MEIIKLPSAVIKERKQLRAKNLKKKKHAYNQLKQLLVPKELKIAQFRRFYHSVLTTNEKEILLKMKKDPWSMDGLKYVGDCKRFKVKIGQEIPSDLT